jgi:hypothetical protein
MRFFATGFQSSCAEDNNDRSPSVSINRYPLSAIRYPLSAIRYPLSAIRYPLFLIPNP